MRRFGRSAAGAHGARGEMCRVLRFSILEYYPLRYHYVFDRWV